MGVHLKYQLRHETFYRAIYLLRLPPGRVLPRGSLREADCSEGKPEAKLEPKVKPKARPKLKPRVEEAMDMELSQGSEEYDSSASSGLPLAGTPSAAF